MNHRAGFVSIIGSPNVGKSTLMNVLVGEKLSIITHKAQTTRHRIMGIFSGDDFQVVYSDTPGILKPHYMLHKAMLSSVYASIADADIILLVTEIGENFAHEEVLANLRASGTPVIVVINKVDLAQQPDVEQAIEKWKGLLEKADIIAVSALHCFNTALVFDTILKHLPESPEYYPKEELTDRSQRFFISEIIREKILLNFSQEIPYSVEVVVDSFKEEEKLTRISVFLFVARESQKAIILGHQGKAIKKLGIAARKDIEAFLEKHIFLELNVKIRKDWRDDPRELKRFGYSIDEN
ncbi:MAG: GTPase Era [Bacteroidetes bacterium]|nr:GTPase Era [Bacteroidota bacterium]